MRARKHWGGRGLGHGKVRKGRKMDGDPGPSPTAGAGVNCGPESGLRLDLGLRMRRRGGRPAGQVGELHPRAQIRTRQTENMHRMQPQEKRNTATATACAATDSAR